MASRRIPVWVIIVGCAILAIALQSSRANVVLAETDTEIQIFELEASERHPEPGGPVNNPWIHLETLNPDKDPDGQCEEGYASGTGYQGTPQWVEHTIDLTDCDHSFVNIRFSFDTQDSLYNKHAGWWLKDIRIDGTEVTAWTVEGSHATVKWHGSDSSWRYYNPETDTYQPYEAGCDDQRNWGTLTSGAYQTNSHPQLTFSTKWEIESIDPPGYDLMQIYVEEVATPTVLAVTTENDAVCLNNVMAFKVTTSPLGNEHLVKWSGGGSPPGQDGGAQFQTRWDTVGTKTVTAAIGESSKSKDIVVVYVALEPMPRTRQANEPSISSPNICLNAQDVYKTATWKATVKPSGTTAQVVKISGNIANPQPASVTDGQSVSITGTGTIGGPYLIKIRHINLPGDCTDLGEGEVFRLAPYSDPFQNVLTVSSPNPNQHPDVVRKDNSTKEELSFLVSAFIDKQQAHVSLKGSIEGRWGIDTFPKSGLYTQHAVATGVVGFTTEAGFEYKVISGPRAKALGVIFIPTAKVNFSGRTVYARCWSGETGDETAKVINKRAGGYEKPFGNITGTSKITKAPKPQTYTFTVGNITNLITISTAVHAYDDTRYEGKTIGATVDAKIRMPKAEDITGLDQFELQKSKGGPQQNAEPQDLFATN